MINDKFFNILLYFYNKLILSIHCLMVIIDESRETGKRDPYNLVMILPKTIKF